MSGSPKQRRPRGREDWLEAAFHLAGAEGMHAVSVNRLARELGITRGSFYHHFEGRDDLLGAMLEYWETTSNDEVFGAVERSAETPEARLCALLRLVDELDAGRFERAMAAWATWDEAAWQRRQEVHGRRLEFLMGLFRAMGFEPAEVRARSHAVHAFILGDVTLDRTLSPKERSENRKRQLAMFIARPVDSTAIDSQD